jgi:hypothetical protein
MTVKVGTVEREEIVIVRQGHNMYISEVADTDATIVCGVVYSRVRGNGAVSNQLSTLNNIRRDIFCAVRPRGYIAGTSMQVRSGS